MNTSLYRALTADKPSEKLAKEASDDITKEFNAINKSINEIKITMASMDTKIDALDAKIDSKIDTTFNTLDAKIDATFNVLDAKFNILIGLNLAVFTLILTGLIKLIF